MEAKIDYDSKVANAAYSSVETGSGPGPIETRTRERKGNKMVQKAFQHYYPDQLSHCYGCGRLNPEGLRIESYWDGDESVCEFTPKPHHTAFPGYVYGGVIASLIDCHGTGTASAAAYRAEGREMDTLPYLRYVTGSLHVDFLKPTPIGGTLMVRASVTEIKGRKVVVKAQLHAGGQVCARGEVVAVKIPEDWGGDSQ